MTSRNGQLWIRMAKQIYCEHGRDDYRNIGNFANGAPFLFGSTERISIAHADHLLVVATLPRTPDVNLGEYSRGAALGVDAERLDRCQVLKIRERFLNAEELKQIPSDDLGRHIVAWTAKEALYKAAMTEGLDFREHIRIETLPEIDRAMNRKGHRPVTGCGVIVMPDGREERLCLYAYESENHCVTLAFHRD